MTALTIHLPIFAGENPTAGSSYEESLVFEPMDGRFQGMLIYRLSNAG